MSGAMSDYFENLVIDWLRGTQMPTPPTVLVVAFYTNAPSDAGGGTEVSASGTAYARQSIATPVGWTKSVVGTATRLANTALLTCPTATGAGWGLVTHAALFDALAGNMLAENALDVAKQIDAGEWLEFQPGALYFGID